jgi:hypothetical protein
MRNLLALVPVACGALLGCGFSSGEVSLGQSLTVDVHHSPAGRTSVTVTTSSRTCTPAMLSVAPDTIDARLDFC